MLLLLPRCQMIRHTKFAKLTSMIKEIHAYVRNGFYITLHTRRLLILKDTVTKPFYNTTRECRSTFVRKKVKNISEKTGIRPFIEENCKMFVPANLFPFNTKRRI